LKSMPVLDRVSFTLNVCVKVYLAQVIPELEGLMQC
jgi:hypothetical protein